MITVVLPTLNERESIVEMLEQLKHVCLQLSEPLEILIVDDQSSDGTVEAAEGFFRGKDLGRVIRREGKPDLIAAIAQGILEARGEYIGVMDSDLSHPPNLLPELLARVKAGEQIAVASRYVQEGGIRNWPWRRRTLSLVGNLLAKPLVPVQDATSGYFVARAELLKPVSISNQGFKILLEILSNRHVRRVVEVPYVFKDRHEGKSKLKAHVLVSYLRQLRRLYWRKFTGREDSRKS